MMDLHSALAHLDLPWPRGSKLACPYHEDRSPSLHLYERTNSWTCFACQRNGDAYGLIAAINQEPVEDVLRRLHPRDNQAATVKPARTYMLREKLQGEIAIRTQPLFDAIRVSENIEEWQRELLAKEASDWMDDLNAQMKDMAPFDLERSLNEIATLTTKRMTAWNL